jgi:hypothetical protein
VALKTKTAPKATYRSFRPPHVLTDSLRDFQRTQAGRDFRSMLGFFPPEWNAFVMGGLLRDLLLERVQGIEAKPADIDIVISGAGSVHEIQNKLGNTSLSTNAFGGVKSRVRPNGILFDLWRMEDHTNIPKRSSPPTIEQLLRHNLLDIDAILWDPKNDQLHDCGCLKAITAERIDLAGREGISDKAPAAQVAHVLAVAYKTNFPLSAELRSFVVTASRRCDPAEIESILERKLPHAAVPIEMFWKDILSGGTQECPAPTRAPIPQATRAKRSSSSLNTRH